MKNESSLTLVCRATSDYWDEGSKFLQSKKIKINMTRWLNVELKSSHVYEFLGKLNG